MHSSSPGRVGTVRTLDRGPPSASAFPGGRRARPTRPGDPHEGPEGPGRHDGRRDVGNAQPGLALCGVRPGLVARPRRRLTVAPGRDGTAAAGHLRRPDRPRRGRRRSTCRWPNCSTCTSRRAGPLGRAADVPRRHHREGALRHRRRRERRRRQEHDGPHPAGAARPLARPPAGRPRDDRRLPVPERGARRARAHGAQGLPRELRPPRAWFGSSPT